MIHKTILIVGHDPEDFSADVFAEIGRYQNADFEVEVQYAATHATFEHYSAFLIVRRR